MGDFWKADCFCRGPDTFLKKKPRSFNIFAALIVKIVGDYKKVGLIYNDGGCIIVGELEKKKYFYNYFCTSAMDVVRYLHVTGLPAGIKWLV